MYTETDSLPTLPPRKTLLWIVAGFFVATFALYGWGLKNPFVRWDDGLLVYENLAVRQITPETVAYVFTHYDPELYIPLTFLTYQFDYAVGGGSPVPFHLGNLLLHTLNALLCGWIAFLLSRKGWIGLVIGLLFAVHPLHTEAVMWVSARKDVLSAFFFLLSVVGYLYARERDSKRLYWGSVAAFTLGLLAKVMIIPLPLVLILIDVARYRRFDRSMITDKIPYFVVALVFGLIALYGKTGVLESSPLSTKITVAFLSAVFYIKQTLLPLHLSLLYPYVKPITLASPDFYVPLLILIAITAVTVMLWKRTRWPLFCFAFYLLMTGPSFINSSKGELDTYFASDRYVYLGSFGILFCVLLVVAWLWDSLRLRKEIVFGGAAVVLIAASVKAYAQSKVWTNTETLFSNVIVEYPDASHVAYNNLGNVYRMQNQMDKAVDAYRKGLVVREHPKVLSNLGATLRKMGDRDGARKAFTRAFELNPASRDAHFGMGLLLSDEGRYAESIAEYELALKDDPLYEEAYTNLCVTYMKSNDFKAAAEACRKGLLINPYFPEARYNLALALTQDGDFPGAVTEYERLISSVPQFIPARLNLSLLYAKTGRTDDARDQAEAVLRLQPQNAAAQQILRQLPVR